LTKRFTPSLWVGDAVDFMLAMPAGCADLILIDPPYGLSKASWDIPIPFDRLWEGFDHVTRPNTPIVVHSMRMFTARMMVAWADRWRWNYVWAKGGGRPNGFLNAKNRPLGGHEDVCVFSKKAPYYDPQFTYGHKPLNSRGNRRRTNRTDYVYGQFDNTPVDPETATRRYPTTVLRYDPDTAGEVVDEIETWLEFDAVKYPVFEVQKPLALEAHLIRQHCPEGGVVLDPTMGSGTAAVAAANTGRRFFGTDLHMSQYRLACERVATERDLVDPTSKRRAPSEPAEQGALL